MDLFKTCNFWRKDLGSDSGQEYKRKKQKKVEPTLYQRCKNLFDCTRTLFQKKVIDKIENKFRTEKDPEKTVIPAQQELITGLGVKLQETERRKKEVEAALQDTNKKNKKLEAEIKELRKKCEDKNSDKKKTCFKFWRMRADAEECAKEHKKHLEEGDTNIEFLCNRITRLQEILEEKECDEAILRHDVTEFPKTLEERECLKKETEARLRGLITSLKEGLKKTMK
jgi:chromosome segregation ATPase